MDPWDQPGGFFSNFNRPVLQQPTPDPSPGVGFFNFNIQIPAPQPAPPAGGSFGSVSGIPVLEHNDSCYLDDPSDGNAMLRMSGPYPDIPQTFQDIESNPSIQKIDPAAISVFELIGAGYFGEVRRGVMYGQEIAIKRIVKARFRDRNDAQMFGHEIAIVSKVSHPNILQFYGITILQGEYCMIMEYMGGGTLRKFIDGYAAFLNNFRLKIMKSITEGMCYLHSWSPHPILHRDLSSVNILLDKNANPKIADFGLSRLKPSGEGSGGTRPTGAVGGAAWMAPEVFRNEYYDTKADVFSFGIVCWEICHPTTTVTGGYDPELYAAMVALRGHRPPLDENIPLKWKQLISTCWAPFGKDRPSFVQIRDYLNVPG